MSLRIKRVYDKYQIIILFNQYKNNLEREEKLLALILTWLHKEIDLKLMFKKVKGNQEVRAIIIVMENN